MNWIDYDRLNVKIFERFDCLTTEIWVHGYEGDKMYNFNYDDERRLVRIEVNTRQAHLVGEYKPFLSFPTHFANLLFKGILAKLEENGVKTKDQNLIEGKLQATELHLTDMRKLSDKLIDFITNTDKK